MHNTNRTYNSFDDGASSSSSSSTTARLRRRKRNNHIKSSSGSSSKEGGVHYYSTPVVSAPLITAFGLPTLIECEPSTSFITESVVEEAADEEEASTPKFTPIHKKSLPPVSSPGDNTTNTTNKEKSRSKSFFDSLFHSSSQDLNEGDTTTTFNSNNINAYTYRIRSDNEHNILRLSQNPDGTYSHHTTSSMINEAEFGKDDIPENDTGLLMSSQKETRTSVSLDTVTQMEETLNSMDNGTLPKHVHPNIPEEMMETLEEITETAPALKLWPLAVLVFYSEFIIYIVFDV